ncbi:MAG: hypothetical protein P4M11_11075 [Candidatus Pacebacteria bacterium]|nr:hypothetical protein [Candidatus Paceibacterota bacterium]
MEQHLLGCCLNFMKLSELALQDAAPVAIGPLLRCLVCVYDKLLAPALAEKCPPSREDRDRLVLQTSVLLRLILTQFVDNDKRRSTFEDDASALHCLEEVLLAIAVNPLFQRRVALEVVRLWVRLALINDSQRVPQMLDALCERMGELAREKGRRRAGKKACFEYVTEPAIQLAGTADSTRRIQLSHYMILRAIQSSIVGRCGGRVPKLIGKGKDTEQAKQELNEAAKIISAVIGKLLQKVVNECREGSPTGGERAFLCQGFIEDVLMALYDLSLPVASWVFRVLAITIVKLLETERKNTQFRQFLATLLVQCYRHVLSSATAAVSSTKSPEKVLEGCRCKGTADVGQSAVVIRCELCRGLFHNSCVGVAREDAEAPGYSYYCQECLIKYKTLTMAAQAVFRSESDNADRVDNGEQGEADKETV